MISDNRGAGCDTALMFVVQIMNFEMYVAQFQASCPNSKMAFIGYSSGAVITMGSICEGSVSDALAGKQGKPPYENSVFASSSICSHSLQSLPSLSTETQLVFLASPTISVLDLNALERILISGMPRHAAPMLLSSSRTVTSSTHNAAVVLTQTTPSISHTPANTISLLPNSSLTSTTS